MFLDCILLGLDVRLTIKIILITFLAIGHTHCKSPQKGISSISSPSDYIEIEKTSCMGPCPVYKAHYSKKETWYEGTSNVDLIGSYKAVLSQEQWNSLETLIAESDALDTRYKSTNHLDLPTTYLRILHDGSIKEISIYGRPPKAIKKSLDLLTELFDSLLWKKKQ